MKKYIYESLMRNISKSIKRTLNEEFNKPRQNYRVSQISRYPYVSFTCNGEQIMKVHKNKVGREDINSGFEYSVDGGAEWFELSFLTDSSYLHTIQYNHPDSFEIYIPFTDRILLRGISEYGTCVYEEDIDEEASMNYELSMQINFENDIPVKVHGDIRTLVDWKNWQRCDTSKARFSRLSTARFRNSSTDSTTGMRNESTGLYATAGPLSLPASFSLWAPSM